MGVGKVIDGEHAVNLALLGDRLCWWYRKYADEQSPADRGLYEAAEGVARDRGRGLWRIFQPRHRHICR